MVREQRVHVLEPQEINTLLKAAELYEGGSCLPAVGLMLYAGIRPHEVVRLNWEHIDLEQGFISILPRHSKTGGARRVSILKPLKRILRRAIAQQPKGRICPRNWRKRWQDLRRQAGWDGEQAKWPQDTLRHTFASYHLSYFRDYTALQWEMGHCSSALLRSRYADTTSVRDARAFWGVSDSEKTLL